MVEVLKRYANRTDALADVRRATERLRVPLDELVPDQGPGDFASASAIQGARLVAARYSPRQIASMVARFQAGTTLSEVATEYRIGLTTLKRLLRLRKSRRTDLGQRARWRRGPSRPFDL